MKYKPDWDEARERLTRMWEGKPLERPCIAVAVSHARRTVVNPADKHDRKDWGPEIAQSYGMLNTPKQCTK